MSAEDVPEGWELIGDADAPRAHFGLGPKPELITSVRSLKDLMDRVLGRGEYDRTRQEDAGWAHVVPFPFLAMVGLREARTALLLSAIHPGLGGVLLAGPSGVGKSILARSFAAILPPVVRSLCYYGCLPEDIERGGLEAVCADCARKYQAGEPLATESPARFFALDPTVTLDDLIGQPSPPDQGPRFRKGLLAQADGHVVYLDDLARYPPLVVEAVLEAAAMGYYTVQRPGWTASYRSRFLLVASVDPTRTPVPQPWLERFALRAVLHPPQDDEARQQVYEHVRAWQEDPGGFAALYRDETEALRAEIHAARVRLPRVRVAPELVRAAIQGVQRLGLRSPRAEYAWLEAARAHAAAEGREYVRAADLDATATLALRWRETDLTPEAWTTTEAADARRKDRLAEVLAPFAEKGGEA
ncbi:MAG: hypothetical protein GXO36_05095 [Chloroflexi bacterium]|nr:hypothetical protein [Chloroflexota bacterium]